MTSYEWATPEDEAAYQQELLIYGQAYYRQYIEFDEGKPIKMLRHHVPVSEIYGNRRTIATLLRK